MRDKEYPPLVANGFKDIPETDLHKEFVSPFSYQAQDHRNNLLIGLGSFLNEFKKLNINAEIWIDGSFATMAPDPADVDVVFYLDLGEVTTLDDKKAEMFQKLFGNRKFIKNLYKVEAFLSYTGSPAEYVKWQRVFGTGYDYVSPKGIFRIYITRQ